MNQLPSGGCVLKHEERYRSPPVQSSAAFRRLCVETKDTIDVTLITASAAFRRLCVETKQSETEDKPKRLSRLQAAVC